MRGRGDGTPRARRGYDYVHQAIDDMSRVAYVDVFADERGPTCAAFLREAAAWFARQGVRIERVMTDNAKNYTRSRDFQAALVDVAARHKRTRPYRPQTKARASASTGRCSTSGLTRARMGRTTTASSPCQTSSITTTATAPTPR